LVNTERRNHCDSLDDLVCMHDLDRSGLLDRLAAADFIYREEINQFRQVGSRGRLAGKIGVNPACPKPLGVAWRRREP
jgi:hypothetical protein